MSEQALNLIVEESDGVLAKVTHNQVIENLYLEIKVLRGAIADKDSAAILKAIGGQAETLMILARMHDSTLNKCHADYCEWLSNITIGE